MSMHQAQPPIEIYGITVLEPVTTLTDLLVAAVCLYAFIKLKALSRTDITFVYIRYFFLTMALATTVGGIIGHAFLYYFGFIWKVPGWIISMASVALLERASIQHARGLMPKRVGNIFAIVNIVELITFVIISVSTLNFFFVEVHAAYGMLVVVFSFELFVYLKTRDAGSRLFLWAVGVCALSAAVHLSRFSLHTWFNYFDISHVLMAIAAWLFYLGAKKIKTTT